MPNLYIDEAAGSDSTATGSKTSPFATAVAAYQSLKSPTENDANPFAVANFLVKKVEGDKTEWVELGKSAQKKLVKGIDIWRKKELKQAQEGEKLAKEKKEMEERDAKRREEARGIVLHDDPSKEAKKVRLSLDYCSLLGKDLPIARTRWPKSQDSSLGSPIPTSS